jgi:hypothetical protein
MSNDTDAVCVDTALILCLKMKKRIAARPKNGTEEHTHTHQSFQSLKAE